VKPLLKPTVQAAASLLASGRMGLSCVPSPWVSSPAHRLQAVGQRPPALMGLRGAAWGNELLPDVNYRWASGGWRIFMMLPLDITRELLAPS